MTSRCSRALYLLRHEPLLTLRRDEKGKPTGVIDWECQRCGRIYATTELKPKVRLLVQLRRQVSKLRRVA